MGRSRKFGRPVSGVLLLNKSAGLSSNHALQRAKRLFSANKAGHTGSLDPLATGVLPICFGEATKFSQYLLDADKRYQSTFTFGATTDTADKDGQYLELNDASNVTLGEIEAQIAHYLGDILQVPPMVSALKHNGQPLYKLARQGIEIERAARAVTIYSFQLLDFRPGERVELDVDIHCSKGTYIRSLADDLGRALGVGGYVSRLHRTFAGGFDVADAVSLEDLASVEEATGVESLDRFLRPVDALVSEMPELIIDAHSGHYFCQGQAVMDLKVYRLGEQGDTVRVRQQGGQFLGVGEITDDGRVAPRRLIATS